MIKNPHRIWHPYTQHHTAGEPIFIERAEGAYLYTSGGRKILDAISSWWVTLHGHAHSHIAHAIAEQSRKLEQVIFAGFTHEPAEILAEKLLAIVPKNLAHVFYSDDGSTAVEVAIKMAIGYWKNKGTQRQRIIAFEHAYHGDTFGAMSVSERGVFTSSYQQFLFTVDRLPVPVKGHEQQTVDAFEKLLRAHNKEIAALIVEPLVLGAAGMIMYSSEILKILRELCSRYNILFIADEVMTGFGRTGTMFASDQRNIEPDILCLSKGITGGFLPLGATIATPEIFNAFSSSDKEKTFFHGHSYTANPIACAAARANLEIFEREPVTGRIAMIHKTHERELKRFADISNVKEVRQCGTIAAVELGAERAGYLSEVASKLYNFYLSKNILLRPLGNVVYILPPYSITEEELVHCYDAIEESLSLA